MLLAVAFSNESVSHTLSLSHTKRRRCVHYIKWPHQISVSIETYKMGVSSKKWRIYRTLLREREGVSQIFPFFSNTLSVRPRFLFSRVSTSSVNSIINTLKIRFVNYVSKYKFIDIFFF